MRTRLAGAEAARRSGGRGRGGAAGGRKRARRVAEQILPRDQVERGGGAPIHTPAAPPGSRPCGAACSSPCVAVKFPRGSISPDANARAVVIVSIPYPNVRSKQVELERQARNEGAQRGLLRRPVMTPAAFRALNQAVGRCLRHRADHGAILLADDRYAHGANGDLSASPQVASTAAKVRVVRRIKEGRAARFRREPPIRRERASNPSRSLHHVRVRRVASNASCPNQKTARR